MTVKEPITADDLIAELEKMNDKDVFSVYFRCEEIVDEKCKQDKKKRKEQEDADLASVSKEDVDELAHMLKRRKDSTKYWRVDVNVECSAELRVISSMINVYECPSLIAFPQQLQIKNSVQLCRDLEKQFQDCPEFTEAKEACTTLVHKLDKMMQKHQHIEVTDILKLAENRMHQIYGEG
jgi:hypothetical protein